MLGDIRPLMAGHERRFQKQAFRILQKAIVASGAKIILKEPDWDDKTKWTTQQRALTEALSQIGMLYHYEANA